MALPARKMDFEPTCTSEEFETLPEFDARYELLDGRLVEKPRPNYQHGYIAKVILRRLVLFDPDEKLGTMVPEVSIRLSKKDTPLPDLSFWRAGNLPQLTTGAAPKADLAIEILPPHDTASKKRLEEVQTKVRKYQAAGVSLVWVINPRQQTVEVYHPDEAGPAQTLKLADILGGENVIPGFTILVKTLFE